MKAHFPEQFDLSWHSMIDLATWKYTFPPTCVRLPITIKQYHSMLLRSTILIHGWVQTSLVFEYSEWLNAVWRTCSAARFPFDVSDSIRSILKPLIEQVFTRVGLSTAASFLVPRWGHSTCSCIFAMEHLEKSRPIPTSNQAPPWIAPMWSVTIFVNLLLFL